MYIININAYWISYMYDHRISHPSTGKLNLWLIRGKSRLQGPLVVRLGAMWPTELVMFCTVSDPRAFEGLPIIWAVPKQWWAWNKNQQHSDTEYWTFFFCGGHHFQLYPDLDHFWLWQLQILRVPSCKSHYPRPEVSSEPDACFDAGDILWHPQKSTPLLNPFVMPILFPKHLPQSLFFRVSCRFPRAGMLGMSGSTGTQEEHVHWRGCEGPPESQALGHGSWYHAAWWPWWPCQVGSWNRPRMMCVEDESGGFLSIHKLFWFILDVGGCWRHYLYRSIYG